MIAVVTHLTTVQQAHDYLVSIGPALLAFLTGAGASTLYSLLKRDSWSPAVNNGIVLAYSLLLALLDAFLKGTLHVGSVAEVFLLVYGSGLLWYNAHKIVYPGDKSTPDPVLPVVTDV